MRAGSLFVVTMLSVMASAAADTVRLKSGRTVDGQVVKADESAVVVVVRGQPEFFSPADIELIRYSGMRIVAPKAGASGVGGGSGFVAMEGSMLDALKRRASRVPQAVRQFQSAQARWARHTRQMALKELRQTLQSLLPVQNGTVHVLSVLADLCLLFLIRVPLLWLILWLLSAQPELGQVSQFGFLAHVIKLLLLIALLVACDHASMFGVVIASVAIISAIMGVILLAVRTLEIGVGKAITALALAATLNVALEYLLVNTGIF